MKNYVQDGDTVPFTAAAATSSGDGVLSGSLFGVATADVANGADGQMKTTGVFTMAKSTAASSAVTLYGPVYWDDTNKVVTGDATGNTRIGIAMAAQVDGDDTAVVRLDGVGV